MMQLYRVNAQLLVVGVASLCERYSITEKEVRRTQKKEIAVVCAARKQQQHQRQSLCLCVCVCVCVKRCSSV